MFCLRIPPNLTLSLNHTYTISILQCWNLYCGDNVVRFSYIYANCYLNDKGCTVQLKDVIQAAKRKKCEMPFAVILRQIKTSQIKPAKYLQISDSFKLMPTRLENYFKFQFVHGTLLHGPSFYVDYGQNATPALSLWENDHQQSTRGRMRRTLMQYILYSSRNIPSVLQYFGCLRSFDDIWPLRSRDYCVTYTWALLVHVPGRILSTAAVAHFISMSRWHLRAAMDQQALPPSNSLLSSTLVANIVIGAPRYDTLNTQMFECSNRMLKERVVLLARALSIVSPP